LVNGPLQNIFYFKERIVSLEKVELSAQVDSYSNDTPLFRVILAKRLDLYIEKAKSYLSETSSGEALPEEKTLSFESINAQDRIQIKVGLDE